MTTNTGGPAFAVAELANIKWEGMTLRDYFAAKAMQTMAQKYSNQDDVSRNAYKIADAMLKARKA